MKIWRIKADASNFKRLRPKGEISSGDFVRSFDGSSKIESWEALKVMFEPEDKNKPIGDFIPFVGGCFVVNERTSTLMEKHFGEDIELLPLDVDRGLYIINILDVGKYIDYEKSTLDYFRNSDRIMAIDKYEFVETLVYNRLLFKDDGFPVLHIFVTDAGKKIIEDWGVSGVVFKEMWDSSH